ncbi:uncharacterized protein LOC143151805 [Ptiloglossa arizonensis]|uniref:uncharacterized protein LOC143151805 n=1 Tax=Ptiloglossa arizonensis TaxID=3350558 RepID=UPI003F9F5EBF
MFSEPVTRERRLLPLNTECRRHGDLVISRSYTGARNGNHRTKVAASVLKRNATCRTDDDDWQPVETRESSRKVAITYGVFRKTITLKNTITKNLNLCASRRQNRLDGQNLFSRVAQSWRHSVAFWLQCWPRRAYVSRTIRER